LISVRKDKKINKVIRVENREFLFEMRIAQELNVGFIPVIKSKNRSDKTISATYDLDRERIQ
jgi:adenine/guanine phosphoribosyltransferase-like PRPP-binding protein